jgi:hypothetical protein
MHTHTHISHAFIHRYTYRYATYIAFVPAGWQTHTQTHTCLQGGETDFLDALPADTQPGEEPHVILSVVPKEGSILLFPHRLPHQGNAVGKYPKVLLRGDLY